MKLRKLLLTIFVLLFVGFGTCLAQDNQAENHNNENANDPFGLGDLSNPGIEHTEALKKFGLKYFLSVGIRGSSEETPGGSGNSAYIKQVGSHNKASLTQSGENLYGSIYQNGDWNDASVSQTGYNLVSLVNMEGNYNALEFTQSGSNKGALFNFQGNNLKFTAEQTGNGKGLQLKPQNSGMPMINIQTTRRTLPIIISNN